MMMVMGHRKSSSKALQSRKVEVMIVVRAQPGPYQHGNKARHERSDSNGVVTGAQPGLCRREREGEVDRVGFP